MRRWCKVAVALAVAATASLSHASDFTLGPVVAQEYRFVEGTVKSTGLLTVGAFKYEAVPQWVSVFAFYGLSNRQYGDNGQVAGAGAELLKRDVFSATLLGGCDVDDGWGALRYREEWFIGAGVAWNGLEFDPIGDDHEE
jgi:hypothetical protein